MARRKAKTLFLKTKCFMHCYVWLRKWFISPFAGIITEININRWQRKTRTEDGPVMMDGHKLLPAVKHRSFRNDFPFLSCVRLTWETGYKLLRTPLLYIRGPERVSNFFKLTQLLSGSAGPEILNHFQVQRSLYCITLRSSYVDHCECLINTRFLTAAYLLLIAD